MNQKPKKMKELLTEAINSLKTMFRTWKVDCGKNGKFEVYDKQTSRAQTVI